MEVDEALLVLHDEALALAGEAASLRKAGKFSEARIKFSKAFLREIRTVDTVEEKSPPDVAVRYLRRVCDLAVDAGRDVEAEDLFQRAQDLELSMRESNSDA